VEEKRGQATFLLQKVASPLLLMVLFNFTPYKYKSFNGVNPTLPSFQRVPSALLRSAGNSIPDWLFERFLRAF